MGCLCGTNNCIGNVEDFKYLPTDLQQKYLEMNIVQGFIAKKYQRENPSNN